MSTIKVGLLGGGSVADAHIRGYRAYADLIEVTAVADVVAETADRRAAELGGAAYTNFQQMINEGDFDAVDICLPHHLHADAIVAAAQAGKHILCEKPLCLTVEQASQVRRAVSAAGVTLMCAHNQLYLPAVPPPGTERFSIIAEGGTLHSDGLSLTLTPRGSRSETHDFEAVDTYAIEIGRFADCLQSGTRPLHTEKEGIDVLCLILAAYEGARTQTIAPVFRDSDS